MLNLSVPAIEESSAIFAETNLEHLEQLISALPADDPVEAARKITQALALLNRRQVSASLRSKALERYRVAVVEIIQGLACKYCDQPLPLPDSAKEVVHVALRLYIELAYGYKHVVLAEGSRLFSLSGDKQMTQNIQRAMEALSNVLLVSYQSYLASPAGVWLEMHKLYLYSLQQSLQDIDVDDGVTPCSINLTYKRALLLALADTRYLNTLDIMRLVDYLERFAHLAQLRPFGIPENPAGVYMLRLDSDKPPLAFRKSDESPDPRTSILLITLNLARQVHHHLGLLHAHEPPAKLGVPECAKEPRYHDMLVHLLKQWGNTPKRLFPRVEKTGAIDMCAGMSTLHRFLNAARDLAENPIDKTQISLKFSDSPIDSGGVSTFNYARWMIVNESAGGMGLSEFDGAPVVLRVGDLLGLRTEKSPAWSVAVLRWALWSGGSPLDIGAQMLAPSAKPVHVRTAASDTFNPALLLPEIQSLNQPATLITGPGMYKIAGELLLLENGSEKRVLATRLIERTGSFERFRFSWL